MRLKNFQLFVLECVSQKLIKMKGLPYRTEILYYLRLKCYVLLAVVVADDVVTVVRFEYAYEALAVGVFAAVVGSYFAVSELYNNQTIHI